MAKEAPSKSDAIREAVKAGVMKPKAITVWIKKTHGIDVTPGMVSTTISLDKKRAAAGAGVSNKLPVPATTTASAKLPKPAPNAADGSLSSDLTALAGLVQKYGANEVGRLADVLGAIRVGNG